MRFALHRLFDVVVPDFDPQSGCPKFMKSRPRLSFAFYNLIVHFTGEQRHLVSFLSVKPVYCTVSQQVNMRGFV